MLRNRTTRTPERTGSPVIIGRIHQMVVRHIKTWSNETEHSNQIRVVDPFHGHISISYELVTPAVAQEWLTVANKRNRRVNGRHLETIIRHMTDGLWLLTTDAIGFDSTGQLLNGQHRLNGIVRAGVSHHFIIVRGLDPDTFDYTDLGRKRQAGDLLDRLGGYIYTTQLGAVLRLMLIFRETGQFIERQQKYTSAEIVHHLDREPNIEKAVERALQLRSNGLKSVPPGLVAALYHILSEYGPDDIDPFMERFATGIGIEDKSDPVYALRRRLEESKGLTKNEKAELVIKAWNYYRRGKSVTKLVVTKEIPQPK